MKYSLIRGLIIEDITVFDKVQDKESILLTIKEISGHILFLPLIKERKIIIPIIHLDSPYLYIRYQQDYKFNFSRLLLPPTKPQAKPRIKFSFLIYKINIFNGRCVFEDENLQPHFTKTIQDFNLGLSISPLSKIVFLIQGKLLAEKNAVTKLSGHGQYDLSSRELNAKINFANLIVPEFNPYLKALPLSISSGTVENSDLDLKFKNNLINLKGSLLLKGLELKKDNLALTGDIYVTPELNYAIDKKIFDYQANLGVLSAELAGLPYLEKVKNINGDIGLTQNRLWANNLKLQALDSDFTLKGTLDDFSNPFLKANLTCEQLSLEKFLSILPSKPEVLNLSGVAKANINIEGNLKKMPLDIKASLDLTESKLQTAFLKEPLSNIKGKIDFSTDMLNWLNLNFNYLNTAYTSSGKLANFKAPQINFDLNSPDLDLKSDIKIKDKLIKINTLTAKFVDSKFNLKGDIDTQDNANPTLDLYAELNLKPQNAFTFLPQDIAETLKKMQLGDRKSVV